MLKLGGSKHLLNIAKSYIETSGDQRLFLFKTMAGQSIFQLFDTSGPVSKAAVYLGHFNPGAIDDKGKSGGILPGHMEVRELNAGVFVVGINFEESTTDNEYLAMLRAAHKMLPSALEC